MNNSTVDRLPLRELMWFRLVEAALHGDKQERVSAATVRHAAEVADLMLEAFDQRFSTK